MIFKEIAPSSKLRAYIKCFYYYESSSTRPFQDIVFPSGSMEVIFNLGEGSWQTRDAAIYRTTPPVELWGQVTRPLAIQSIGRNTMLGFRFYPHSAAYFFKEKIGEFNDSVIDAASVFGNELRNVHERLVGLRELNDRVLLLEEFLWGRLGIAEKKQDKIKFIGEIARTLRTPRSSEKILSISRKNHISSRYLNLLFSQYTGLPPKLFFKINRFQHSLSLVNSNTQKLTNVAYDAGYFDQAHFIREFKLFTGITPGSFSNQASPINKVLADKEIYI